MAKGLGTDLIEVDRIFRSIEKTPTFLCRFFGPSEWRLFCLKLTEASLHNLNLMTAGELEAYLLSLWQNASASRQQRLAQTVAANFAGKEAVLKVFGTGLRGCQLSEIEIIRDEMGGPQVMLCGGAQKIATEKGIGAIQISLSHTKDYAIAFAIGE